MLSLNYIVLSLTTLLSEGAIYDKNPFRPGQKIKDGEKLRFQRQRPKNYNLSERINYLARIVMVQTTNFHPKREAQKDLEKAGAKSLK